MFERYTEKSRRVIFFARYEASSFGSPQIETEHFLLGLLREDKSLATRYLKSLAAVDDVRRKIEAKTSSREKISTSADLPMSHGCKRVLAYAAEESALAKSAHIGPAHLMAGLLREDTGLAAEILNDFGLELSVIRGDLIQSEAKQAGELNLRAGMEDLTGKLLARLKNTNVLDFPIETIAELTRQAQGRGVEVTTHVLGLIERALHSDAGKKGESSAERRELYERLRGRIAVEGLPCLDESELAAPLRNRLR